MTPRPSNRESQVQAFPIHYIIQNPTDKVSYSDDTCVRNRSGIFCSRARGKEKAPVLMDCTWRSKVKPPHVTEIYTLRNRNNQNPSTFKISFYFNESFTLNTVLVYYYGRCSSISLMNADIMERQCTDNPKGQKQLVIDDLDLDIGRPGLVLTIRLPDDSSLHLTEVMFFKSDTNDDETATAPLTVQSTPGSHCNKTIGRQELLTLNPILNCRTRASTCIVWEWKFNTLNEEGSILDSNEINVLLPDRSQDIFQFSSSVVPEKTGNYTCIAMHTKTMEEWVDDYCWIYVNFTGKCVTMSNVGS